MSKRNPLGARRPIRAIGCCLLLLPLLSTFAVQAQTPGDISVTIEDVPLVELGSVIDVQIMFNNDNAELPLGGFDFLIEFDTAAVGYLGTTPGELLTDCNWDVPISAVVAPGLVRVAAIAEGVQPGGPNCYLEGASGTLLTLSFQVDDDTLLDCTGHPVQFYWQDCGDNAFSSQTGDELYLSYRVYDWPYLDEIQENDDFPTLKGAPDLCVGPGAPRLVDFQDGGIDIICGNATDDRGDVNLNGIPNEIADWLLFYNYFLWGTSAFTIDLDRQIATTDVNNDGFVLTIRDLVYLQRVIIGDVNPIPKLAPQLPADTARFLQGEICPNIYLDYGDSLASIFLKFDGAVGLTLIPDGFDVSWLPRDDTTFVLITPTNLEKISLGGGDLLTYTGPGRLVYAEVADYEDRIIATSTNQASFKCVKLVADDVTLFRPESTMIIPVYIQSESTTVAGFSVQFTISHPDVARFNTDDPIAEVGEAIADWEFLTTNDLGSDGVHMRVVGLYNLPSPPENPSPMQPSPEERLLFSLNADLVDPPAWDSLCGFDMHAFFVMDDISDSAGHLLETGSKDAKIKLRCVICGDCNSDGIANISDAVRLICWIFGSCLPPDYVRFADVDCDGIANISDAVYLINFIFGGGGAPCSACP